MSLRIPASTLRDAWKVEEDATSTLSAGQPIHAIREILSLYSTNGYTRLTAATVIELTAVPHNILKILPPCGRPLGLSLPDSLMALRLVQFIQFTDDVFAFPTRRYRAAFSQTDLRLILP
jgi:hypothetical protein